MAWFRREKRAIATQSNSTFMQILGLDGRSTSSAGESVTVESALGVPAVWAAVNFLSGTIAGLPLKVYAKSDDGPQKALPNLQAVLNDVANAEDALSSFDVIKWWVEQYLTGGRGLLYIERNGANRVVNLWQLDPTKVTVKRDSGRKWYEYRDDASRVIRYEAADVLDLPYMLKADGLTHRSPIHSGREAIGKAQAVTEYGARFFSNGGVPPFAVTGNFQSGASLKRASEDLQEAVRKAAKEKRQALTLPEGLDIKPIGTDAEKSQMIEAQRWCVEEIARIYSLPPIFLQDLTHGTYSNTEQQDLHLAKHTIKKLCEQIEGEMNLKFFGRGSRNYVEFSMDGLLRGAFKERMEGYATAIQAGVMKPDEARSLENKPSAPGGDKIFVQGAMIPAEMAGQQYNQGGEDGEEGNSGGVEA